MFESRNQTIYNLVCSWCGFKEQLVDKITDRWLIVSHVQKHGLFLIEKYSEVKSFESLSLPHVKHESFCQRDCLKSRMMEYTELFIASLNPPAKPDNQQKL